MSSLMSAQELLRLLRELERKEDNLISKPVLIIPISQLVAIHRLIIFFTQAPHVC